MADVVRCRKCFYWRGANGTNMSSKMMFCHHLLVTNKRRVENADGVCESFAPRIRKRKKNAD